MRAASFFLLLVLLAPRSDGGAYWNEIRHSALLPDSRVTIRMENPSGAGIQNFLLYASGGIQDATLTSVLDGPSTLEGTIPGPLSQRAYYGFRLLQGTEIDLLPVRLGDGVTPTPQDLTRVAEDPPGDHFRPERTSGSSRCRAARQPGSWSWLASATARASASSSLCPVAPTDPVTCHDQSAIMLPGGRGKGAPGRVARRAAHMP